MAMTRGTTRLYRDAAAERKYKFSLHEALARRKEGKVLDGMQVYCTAGVKPPKAEMKGIVTAAGGAWLATKPKAASPNLLFVSSDADLKKAAVKKLVASLGVPVYSNEVVLSSVLQQRMVTDGDGVVLQPGGVAADSESGAAGGGSRGKARTRRARARR